MAIRYTVEALADLLAIVDYGLDHGQPDPIAYVDRLRERIEHLDSIRHPGRKGRQPDTKEWVVSGTRFVAVFVRKGGTVIVLRVLHGARQWPPPEAARD